MHVDYLDVETLADVFIICAGLIALYEYRRQREHAVALGVVWPLFFVVFGLLATSIFHGLHLLATVVAFKLGGVDGATRITDIIVHRWSWANSLATVISLGTGIYLLVRRVLPTARETLERLEMARAHLSHEVEIRRRAEEDLRASQVQLEQRIEIRTADLESSNRQLEEEIAQHKCTLREVEDRVGFEGLIGRISANLVYRRASGNMSVLTDVLRELVEFAGFDRARVVELSEDGAKLSCRAEWMRSDATNAAQLPQGPSPERLDTFIAGLRRGDVIHFDRPDAIRAEPGSGSNRVRAEENSFGAAVPLAVGGQLLGCLLVTQRRGASLWTGEAVSRLKLIAELLATSLHRSRVEADLKRQAENYRAIFDSSGDAIIVQSPETGEIRDVNQKTCEMWGYTREQVLDSNVQLLSGHDPRYSAERARAVGDGGSQLFEWRARAADGREFWVEVNLHSTEIAGEGAILAMVRDISERKHSEQQRLKLERQLFQSQRMEALGKLAGGVAHDFNNILTVIIGNANLASDIATDFADIDPAIVSCLHEIEASGERAGSLTQQLLAFGRRQMIKPEVMDLNEALADMEGMLRSLIAEDLKLEMNTDPRTPCIIADASQIQQVVLNLVVNSRDAMPMGGVVTIETFTRSASSQMGESDVEGGEDVVVLAVRDTGSGIEAESLDHIFEPFFTTKPVGKGTGLGLATVHGIVKQLGGSIQVESELDKGTSFEISLRACDQKVTGESGADRRVRRVASGETILVCEDDEKVRTLTCTVLRKGGYTVHAASSGYEAIAMSRAIAGPIHALVTDVIMPEMNGKALAEAIRIERPETCVLFVSGYPADVLAPYGVMPDEVEFLEKPFRGGDLLESVSGMLAD